MALWISLEEKRSGQKNGQANKLVSLATKHWKTKTTEGFCLYYNASEQYFLIYTVFNFILQCPDCTK